MIDVAIFIGGAAAGVLAAAVVLLVMRHRNGHAPREERG